MYNPRAGMDWATNRQSKERSKTNGEQLNAGGPRNDHEAYRL